jgi:hypothetical protein
MEGSIPKKPNADIFGVPSTFFATIEHLLYYFFVLSLVVRRVFVLKTIPVVNEYLTKGFFVNSGIW